MSMLYYRIMSPVLYSRCKYEPRVNVFIEIFKEACRWNNRYISLRFKKPSPVIDFVTQLTYNTVEPHLSGYLCSQTDCLVNWISR